MRRMLFTVQIFVTICLLLLSSAYLAASPDEPKTLIDAEVEDKPFDWSRPAVSRGFGYEAGTGIDEHWVGQYKTGQVSYFFGEHSKAFEKWLPLAEQNYAEAQASIGWLFQSGLGVDKDIKKAVYYYKLAAEQNHATAQNNLGVLYEQGLGVDKDLQKARVLYKKSAEQGYRFAEFNYANFLLEGLGGDLDRDQAIAWYRKAAKQEVLAAKDVLAELSKK